MADTPLSLAPQVKQTLKSLRRRIRQYVFWEGLALVAVLAGVLFWGSFLIDAVYFTASRLELPRWFRALFLVGTITALVVGLCIWVGFRAFGRVRRRALALLLERRFPELGDRLITAVEASEQAWVPHSDFEQAMVLRTVSQAAAAVEKLDLSRVFDAGPIRRAIISAVVLVASVLGLAVVNTAAMERWIDGYWRLEPHYWPRKTDLLVQVQSLPSDELHDFTEGRFRHPRGGDLQLVITPVEGKVVPERVRLDYRLRGGSWKRTFLSQPGDQPFQHLFPALLDEVEFWVSGGDYAASTPWRIEVVDPPRLDAVSLAARYPDYTQLNDTGPQGAPVRTILPVLGTQITLPMGTDVLFSGTANKPLSAIRIEVDGGSERFEWTLNRESETASNISEIMVRAHDDLPQKQVRIPAEIAANWLSTDRTGFTIPLVLQKDGEVALRETLTALADNSAECPAVFPWPADTNLRIHLVDADGIVSPEPLRLAINAEPDLPPSLEVELTGISSSITRQARIPVAGLIRDDYGVAQARFDYLIDTETDWQPREFANPVTETLTEVPLARSENEPYQRFDVLPLDLSLKQKLTLTVFAADGDTLNGPNIQRSQKFVFTIVSVEELLSLLYAKELNLRKRFEQILTELKDLRQDLGVHKERAGMLATTEGEPRREIEFALVACAERSLHGVRKNAAEMLSIEQAVREIRDEMVNNAAETPQNMDRLEAKILGPLTITNTEGFPAVDVALGLFSLANQKGQDRMAPLSRSEQELDRVITRLERVLLEMRKLETFHEAIELLKSIMSEHDGLSEDTKTKRKEKALQALE
ncbi:hypothetical protein GC163_22365 [bacterium]|nr:hypothetical protein [bacterium]